MTEEKILEEKLAEVSLTLNECSEIDEIVIKEYSFLTESESEQLISLERSILLIKKQTEIIKKASVEREEYFLDEKLESIELTDDEYEQASTSVDEEYKEYKDVTELQRRQAFSIQCQMLLLDKKEKKLHQISEERLRIAEEKLAEKRLS